VISDLSVNHVERHILRRGFSAERVAHDYGTDVLMFTYSDAGEIENGHVEFQLKATDHLKLSPDARTIAVRVASVDLKLWLWEPFPVILIVYDATKDRAFWLYVQSYANNQGITDATETVTLRVPANNRLNRSAIDQFRSFRDVVLSEVKGVIRHD
jgi:hypothetical protein